MTSTSLTKAATPANPRPILTCARCQSIEIEPVTAIPNASFREAADIAWNDCWAGQGPLAGRFLIRWACVQAANTLRDKYRCCYCGLSFRNSQS